MNKRNKILAIIFNSYIVIFFSVLLVITESNENLSLKAISWVNNILFLISKCI